MATTHTSRDAHAADEPLQLGRAPVDRLLFGCVLAASAAYVVFLVVMQLSPREPEGADKQGYLGVVSGESQPNGLGAGEQDPATGTAELGGRGSAYYIGNGQPPRPVTLVESSSSGESTPRIPARRVQAGQAMAAGGESSLGRLALDELVFARVQQLVEFDQTSALRPAGRALNSPPGHVRVGIGPN